MKIRELQKGDIIIGLSNDSGPIKLTYLGMDGSYSKCVSEGIYGYINLGLGTKLEKVSNGVYRII